MSSGRNRPRCTKALDAEGALSFFDELERADEPVPQLSSSDLSEESSDELQEFSSLSQDDNELVFGEEEEHVVFVQRAQRKRRQRGEASARESPSESEFSDSEISEFSDSEREREPRRRGRGHGRGRGRGRGRGSRQANFQNSTRGRVPTQRGGRGRGNTRVQFDSMYSSQDSNPQERPTFKPLKPAGPQLPDGFDGKREVDFFKLFFTWQLVSAIGEFTNAYAAHHIGAFQTYANAEGTWTSTSANEMYKFFALIIYTGFVKLPELYDYWSTQPLFHGNWARAIIPSRTRFMGLLTFLKVVDAFAEAADDRLRKVRYIYEHMRKCCTSLYQPHQSISVDERIVRCKGRFFFRQYLPKKPVKWGTKLFALCDSSTSYCYDFSIYTGQEVRGETDVGITQRVVQRLSEPLQHQGYIMYTDNFYTSGPLAQALRNDGIQLVGTIKTNRTGVPQSIRNVKEFDKYAARGTMRYERAGDILYVQWKDRRTVTMLSTVHSANESVDITRNSKINGSYQQIQVPQPVCIKDYNSGMGGVDVFDQHIAAYRSLRKANKYWKSIAIDMLEVAVVNSYILFNLYRKANPNKIQRPAKYNAREFRRRLVCQLAGIDEAGASVPVYTHGRKSTSTLPEGKHLVVFTDNIERSCKFCSKHEKVQRKCNTKCSTCDTYLHANHRNCFMKFHS